MLLEPVYIKCPHCGKWYTYSQILSYTLYGNADYWSDGKCYNPNLPEYSFQPFAKCSHCHNFFWIDDCKQLHRSDIFPYKGAPENIENDQLISEFKAANAENADCSFIDYPPSEYWFNLPESMIGDYLEILEHAEQLNKQREIYLRTKLLQHFNDYIRKTESIIWQHIKHYWNSKYLFNLRPLKIHLAEKRKNKRLFAKSKAVFYENLQKLSALLHQIEPNEDVILLIEVERQLGNFDVAQRLFSQLDAGILHENKKFVKLLLKHIKRKSTKVFKIA